MRRLSPDSMWISQIGRNLTDAFCGFLKGKRFIIMDRDASFHAAFRLLLEQSGVRVVRTPPSSPNCNAYIERFHRSFKTEVAERMIFLGEAHLRRAVDEYLVYYHRERNHQGLEGEMTWPRMSEPCPALALVASRYHCFGPLCGFLPRLPDES
uniref:integrase core domain-containing protein n=1 Tax=Cephaloticoccus sp. TaxID=1985742 RepID=UPI00404B6021